MLLVLLPLALAIQQPAVDPQYSSDALRELIRAAAATNIRVPRGLASYTATVETEVALVSVNSRAREQSIQVEQVAQSIAWDRTGQVDQRVVGYRSQASMFTGLTALTVPTWVVPVLYGNRFSLFFGPRAGARASRDTAATVRRVDAVHPLAADRDAIYRFSGGDTVAVVRPGAHGIPVVRVHVDPAGLPSVRTTALRGEILIDAATHQLVALRGELVEIGGAASLLARAGRQLMQAVAYVDFQSREVEQLYWLPAVQRIELQIASPMAGDARAVWRFQSRFDDVEIVQSDTVLAHVAVDTLAALPRRRIVASDAELASYSAWRWAIGEGTADLRAGDFDDVVGGGLTTHGARVTVGLHARRFDDVLRFNRVEGLFTGLGGRVRASRPGGNVALGGSLGLAWHERAVRGGAYAEWDARQWTMSVAGERRLDITNRLGDTRSQGSGTLAALLGSDDADYIDRREVIAVLERNLVKEAAWLEVRAGIASERGVSASVSQGLFRVDSAFRPNRPVDRGSSARVGVAVVVHPDVFAEFARPGWTTGLRVEQGAGDLSWARVEVGAAARATKGRVTSTGRIDAGLVESGRIPLQQLFAIGGVSDVPGFEYKEFGGDRAVVSRATVRYALPILQAPLRLPIRRSRRGILPPLAPMLAIGVRSVWTDASSPATLKALSRLGIRSPSGTLLSRPTNGMPAAASAGVLLFGGGLFIGVSRRLDTAARWSFTFAPSLAL